MTVAEMLSRIDSYEIAEWQAYEKAFGPIGHQYSDNLLAAMHEQLQMLNRITGAGIVEDQDDNPAPAPIRWPRPDEVFKPQSDEEDEGDISIYDEI